MNFTLRPFSRVDQDFLFYLYADTRRDEVALFGWTPQQKEAFLRMQFRAQQNWYQMAYGAADHQIILIDGQPAGRILVFREPDAYRLVDIALLCQFRGQGIGTQLLRDLSDRSKNEGLPLRLQVLKSNPARNLYLRVGFTEMGSDEMYYQMEKKASVAR